MEDLINQLSNLSVKDEIKDDMDELVSEFGMLTINRKEVQKEDISNVLTILKVDEKDQHVDELINMMSKMKIEEVVVNVGFDRLGKLKFNVVACQTANMAYQPIESLPYVDCC